MSTSIRYLVQRQRANGTWAFEQDFTGEQDAWDAVNGWTAADTAEGTPHTYRVVRELTVVDLEVLS